MRVMPSNQALPLWRSILFVPAVSDRFVESALKQAADVLQIDLEDSVPCPSKAEARAAIRQAWPQLQQASCAIVVRINSPDTEWGEQDLLALQGLQGLAGVMVPKTESAQTLARVAEALAGVPSLPIIESAMGYLALREIACAPQVARLVVGHIDFLADTGMACDDEQRELAALIQSQAAELELAAEKPAWGDGAADRPFRGGRRGDPFSRRDRRSSLR